MYIKNPFINLHIILSNLHFSQMNEQVFVDRPITLFCMESLEQLCEFTLGQQYNYKKFWVSIGNFWLNNGQALTLVCVERLPIAFSN